MANPIAKAIGNFRKSVSIAFENGARLVGGSYRGDWKTFFTEMSYGDSDAGISVTSDKALNYTAFWACVTLLSGTLASLPALLFQRLEPRGRERAVKHNLYNILHDEPNPEMDSFSYFETLMYHLCANNGNAYSYKEFEKDRRGDEDLLNIKYLWPMNPDRMTKIRDSATGQIEFVYQSERGGPITLPAYRVWHIPGFGFDGMIGYTPLTHARNLIGTALGAEKMGATIFKNGLTFGGFLSHPGILKGDALKHWEDQLKVKHEGVKKAHQIMILEEGMKYEKNNISPEDAQMLDTMKFYRGQMASFFHVQPHKIGDLDRATFSNIEEQNLEFATDTMRPWCVRIERSANRQLLLPHEKPNFFIEFLMDAILRGNSEARANFYKELYYLGALSPNDIRDKENMNPIPDKAGDEYFTQQNMIALSRLASLGPLDKPADKPKQ